MIHIGEGVERAPEFMKEMMYTTEFINSIEDCKKFNRANYWDKIWKGL